MIERYPSLRNVHLDAVEHGEKIIFMHKVLPGPANQSYGIQVAQLAGIPASVIAEAKKKLRDLKQQTMTQHALQPKQQDLFAPAPHPVLLHLANVNPDQLNPKQALDILYELIAIRN